MRKSDMMVFLLIVLILYVLINFYILKRSRQALAGYPSWRTAFTLVLSVLILSYPAGRVLNGAARSVVSEILIKSGSFYLALMLYFLCAFLILDLIRLLESLLHLLPGSLSVRDGKTGFIAFLAVAVVVAATVIGGTVNALRPRVRTLEIGIDKTAGTGLKSLRVVMASDIHLGTVIGSRRLESIVEKINGLAPDIVFLPGDIVDESVSRAEEERMTEILRRIKSPLGVFSVPGNHEYFSGLETSLDYLRKGGVRVLQDEAVAVAGAFIVAGRKDPTARRYGDRRMPLAEILGKSNLDMNLPIILLDHQPVGLEDAEKAGVDLQLSGHTHAGQLFPLNLINRMIYDQNWGYLRRGKTQYYVSCGVGTWGPPVRTGSVPEIICVNLVFRS